MWEWPFDSSASNLRSLWVTEMMCPGCRLRELDQHPPAGSLLPSLPFPPWLSLLTKPSVPRKQPCYYIKLILPLLFLCFWGVLSKSSGRAYAEHHRLRVRWQDSPKGKRGQERKLCVCIHLWHDGFPLPGRSLGINKTSKGFCVRTPFTTNSHGVIDNKRPGS